MRTVYHDKLTELSTQLAETCGLVATAMEQATEALLEADIDAAESVISGNIEIATRCAHIEELGISLVALQQPVAGELRSIIGAIHVAADVDRMGALAVHVAKLVRRRHPHHVLPDDIRPLFAGMGRVAVELAGIAQEVLQTRDPQKAARIRQQDDAIDDLHRQLFPAVMNPDWQHGAPTAVDVALLGRYYERFADHAVEIGRRVVFEATGVLPTEPKDGT